MFGRSVCLSADGSTALIGVPGDDDNGANSGSAYIYTGSGSSWDEKAKLTGSEGDSYVTFGNDVSLSSDGTYALVGAPNNGKGAAYFFASDGSGWSQEAKIISSDIETNDLLGFSVSLSSDGKTALIGAYGNDDDGQCSGSAYLFTRSGSSWSEKMKLTAPDAEANDYFGNTVSLSADGTEALVGAYLDDDNGLSSGSAYFFY